VRRPERLARRPRKPGLENGCSESVASLTGSTPVPLPTAVETLAPKPSIAVLSLRDLSAARDQGYFCEGLVEELLMSLTRLPGLRVRVAIAGR
jgi:TolB-like protein